MTWASSVGAQSIGQALNEGIKAGTALRDIWDSSNVADKVQAAKDEDTRKAGDAQAREKDGPAGYGPQQSALPTGTTSAAPTSPQTTYNDPPADLSTVPHRKTLANQREEDGRERASQRLALDTAKKADAAPPSADPGVTGAQDVLSEPGTGAMPAPAPPSTAVDTQSNPRANADIPLPTGPTGAQDTMSSPLPGPQSRVSPQSAFSSGANPRGAFSLGAGAGVVPPSQPAPAPAPAPAPTATAPAPTATAPAPAPAPAPASAPVATSATPAPAKAAPAPAPDTPPPGPAAASAAPTAALTAPAPAPAPAPGPAPGPELATSPAAAPATRAPAPQTVRSRSGPRGVGQVVSDAVGGSLDMLRPTSVPGASGAGAQANAQTSAQTSAQAVQAGIDARQGQPRAALSAPSQVADASGQTTPTAPTTGSNAPPGQIAPGNIDLNNRPVVKNADGSISTVRSITVTDDKGQATLIPTVINGKVVSSPQAIQHFKKTGENLGTFSDEASANAYAQQLHEDQAKQYGGGQGNQGAPAQALPAPGAGSTTGSNAAPATPAPANAPNAPIEKGMPPAARVTLPQSSEPIVPGQVTPTTQSEPTPERTPEIRSPGINPQAFAWLVKNRPEDASYVQQMADKYGVSPERIAAHWWKESGLKRSSPDGAAGEQGVMQFKPGTREQVDPEGKLNPYDYHNSIEMGARYIRQLDDRFGKDKFNSIVAYNGGPGTADRLAAGQPTNGNAVRYASHPVFFGGETINASDIKGSMQLEPGKMKDVAEKSGPSGLLNYLATTTPNNQPLSDKWRAAEDAMIRFAITRGGGTNPDPIKSMREAQQWVLEQSRSGVNDNLQTALRSMALGDNQTAAQYLAKAHAFFPDGTIARFGVDEKNQIWTQRLDEHAPDRALGPPSRVTPQQVEQLMLTSKDPNNYVKLLDAQQKNAAEIVHLSKQEDYWKDMGDYKKDMSDWRRQQGEEKLQAARDAAALRDQQFQDRQRQAAEIAAARLQAQRERDEETRRNHEANQAAAAQRLVDAQNVAATREGEHRKVVDTEVNTLYGPESTAALEREPGTPYSSDDKAIASQVYADIRRNTPQVPAPEALRIAHGVVTRAMEVKPGTNERGEPVYVIRVPGQPAQAVLSKAVGDHLNRGLLAPRAALPSPTQSNRAALPPSQTGGGPVLPPHGGYGMQPPPAQGAPVLPPPGMVY